MCRSFSENIFIVYLWYHSDNKIVLCKLINDASFSTFNHKHKYAQENIKFRTIMHLIAH